MDSVIVVSSGSTDRTDSIVESMIPEFPCICLIRQEKREGKNSAINLILREKGTEIVVLLNADNILGSPDSLNRLIEPFSDPKVGVVGGHPVRRWGWSGGTLCRSTTGTPLPVSHPISSGPCIIMCRR